MSVVPLHLPEPSLWERSGTLDNALGLVLGDSMLEGGKGRSSQNVRETIEQMVKGRR